MFALQYRDAVPGLLCRSCFHAQTDPAAAEIKPPEWISSFPYFFNVNVDPSRNYFNTSYRGDGGCKFNLFFWQWGIIIF